MTMGISSLRIDFWYCPKDELVFVQTKEMLFLCHIIILLSVIGVI